MPFEGYVDNQTQSTIDGWVFLASDPDRPLQVEILADGVVVATVMADGFRPDLLAANKGNGKHAFSYCLENGTKPAADLQARLPGKRWLIPRGGMTPPQNAVVRHWQGYGLPDVESGFTPTPPIDPAEETLLAERLLRAFHASVRMDGHIDRPVDVWTTVESLHFGEILNLTRQGNAAALADYLRELFARHLTHGCFQGEVATAALSASPAARHLPAALTADYLASLAECVGALRVEIVEQEGAFGDNLFCSPDQMVEVIEKATGVSVVPPNVAGRKWGVTTRAGIVAPSDVRLYYGALRIRDLLHGSDDRSACEIGGGVGGSAYFAHKFGITDYTIIDMPIMGLLQSYYLARALPNGRLILAGESDSGGAALRILPTSSFGSRGFGVIYNQDSFPEMHRVHSLRYLKKGRDMAPKLLSINQESAGPQSAGVIQPSVPELVREAGGYRRVYRFPHWIRHGYVEELFESTAFQGARRKSGLRSFLSRFTSGV